MIEHLVGFTASTIAFVLFLPQATKTWRLRHDPNALRGIALGTQWLVVANAVLWFLYGWLTQAFWIAAPGFVNLPLAAATIYLVKRARGVADTRCLLCVDGAPHKVLITQPAGYGSLMTCTGIRSGDGVPVKLGEPYSNRRNSGSIHSE